LPATTTKETPGRVVDQTNLPIIQLIQPDIAGEVADQIGGHRHPDITRMNQPGGFEMIR
jgi:hypothetical protein